MPDIDVVITALRRVERYFQRLQEVGYCGDRAIYHAHESACSAAIILLEKQETKPIEPVEEIIGDALLWHCGKCGFYIANSDNFCSHCGRAVKK